MWCSIIQNCQKCPDTNAGQTHMEFYGASTSEVIGARNEMRFDDYDGQKYPGMDRA